jgi:hypothetical protein
MDKKIVKQVSGGVDLVEQARQLRLQAEQLEKAARVARGTERIKRATQSNVIVKPARGPYYVGDESSTGNLMAVVQRMLTERPWRFSEMLEATGARDNRIKGVIMRLQREGVRVVDVAPEGTGKALWFIPSDEVLTRLMRARKSATVKR